MYKLLCSVTRNNIIHRLSYGIKYSSRIKSYSTKPPGDGEITKIIKKSDKQPESAVTALIDSTKSIKNETSKKPVALLSRKLTDTVNPSKIKWENYKFDTIDTEVCIETTEGPIPDLTEKVSDDDCDDGRNEPEAEGLCREEPGEVIWAFVPREWYMAFVGKTGATGFFTLLFTVGVYLISKEILILEHNFYNGLSMAVLWGGAIKYVGPDLTKALDKDVDLYEQGWCKKSEYDMKLLEQYIFDEELTQYEADGQIMLVEAKRENVIFQYEESFRLRQMEVYDEILNRLDYQIAIADINQKILHKNLVWYVQREVLQNLSPELHEKIMWKCIDDILKDFNANTKCTDDEES